MAQKSPENCDVAIVGCGPVGALLALLLGRAGIETLAFERDREVYRLPRAVHFDSEVMRIFQSAGITIEDIGVTAPILGYDFINADGDMLFRFDLAQEITSQGWAPDYMFHQPTLEAALRDALGKQSTVALHLECEVTRVEDDGDAVLLEVRDHARHETREVRARYVVGCDGGNSFVRRSAGLMLEDLEFDEPWLVVDAKVDVPPTELGLPPQPTQLCDPARPVTFVPVAGGYIRWEFMLTPGEAKDEMLAPDRVNAMIDPWVDSSKVEIIRTAVYDFHALVAEEWRNGRVMIAGDAAHQTPPFLGQGMCAGMRDAANLAWRLQLALVGGASGHVFDSYRTERSPHVRALIGIAVQMGRIICTLDPEVAAERDANFMKSSRPERPVPDMPGIGPGLYLDSVSLAGQLGLQARVRADDGSAQLLDDVTGAGFSLLVRGSSVPTLSTRAQQVLADVRGHVFAIDESRDIDRAYAKWFEAAKADAILVRPDHYVFGSASGENAASELLEALGTRL